MIRLGTQIAALSNEMKDHLRDMGSEPVFHIHELRKRTKFMRALLRSCPEGTSDLERSLQQISAILSPYRDAQVNVNLCQALLQAFPESQGSEHLKQLEQDPYFKQFLPDQGSLERLYQLFEDFRKKSGARELTCAEDLYLDQLQKSYRKARKRCSTITLESESDELHRYRKGVKQLWYQLRATSAPAEFLETVDVLGSELGQIHDLDMLSIRTQRRSDPSWRQLLRDQRTLLITKTLQRGDLAFGQTAQAFRAQIETQIKSQA